MSENTFVNATDSHFLLMTNKLGRYAFTGESKHSSRSSKAASKHFRLIAFCSKSLTNKEFGLRVYIVDNLKWALQEVLRDEKKIGGTLLETSEPFLISHSSRSESLSICIENLNVQAFSCKFNVNVQVSRLRNYLDNSSIQIWTRI